MEKSAKSPSENLTPQSQALRGARICAIQALYQIEIADSSPKSVIQEFLNFRIGKIENGDVISADTKLFSSLVEGITTEQARLDEIIAPQLSKTWSIPRLNPIVRAAIRCGLYELLNRPEVSISTIIDEYVSVVASFEAQKEAGFTNAILHSLSQVTGANVFRQ